MTATRATTAPSTATTTGPGIRHPPDAPTDRQPPIRRPETQRQAQTWDQVASRYRAAGFCDRCAAQAAWGHQAGFSRVHPICTGCRGRQLPDRHDVPHARRWMQDPATVTRP